MARTQINYSTDERVCIDCGYCNCQCTEPAPTLAPLSSPAEQPPPTPMRATLCRACDGQGKAIANSTIVDCARCLGAGVLLYREGETIPES